MNRFEIVSIARWIARGLCLLLFLLWGAFFIEHLEWFSNAAQKPPLSVWLLQGMHLLLLVGLLVSLRWEAVGSALVFLSGALFFSQTAGLKTLPLVGLTIVPALLFAFCWWWERRHAPPVPLR